MGGAQIFYAMGYPNAMLNPICYGPRAFKGPDLPGSLLFRAEETDENTFKPVHA